ncbi:MAG: hypothetical protein NUV56_03840, partial [Candidatus Uhrbacteria bacterium]|nr:hypothetical protein [Candidatus Uhrbacteria bacterium]
MEKSIRKAVPFLLTSLGGAIVGASLVSALPWKESDAYPQVLLRNEDTDYTFIKPLLLCYTSFLGEAEEYQPLKSSLENRIQAFKNQGVITEASVYVRELATGKWISINDDATYRPASLNVSNAAA